MVLLLLVGGCATAPSNIGNTCAVFDQRDGWFNNWRKAAYRTESEFGVPVHILMATMYVESGFQPRARPPRNKLFGFIPWKRQSSAYGYAQALDGTWKTYQRATGRSSASRTNFADAIHFVGWYHSESRRRNGISVNNPYDLYLAYHLGHTGYARGAARNHAGARAAAKRFADISGKYAVQLRSCGR
ncbi:putative lipoprotein [Lutibaculum baratangense AMV1]|uniref:Putative lipoprotein n=1 Tax=Lutibaculum baratangense AMV1 TaxID=631454 RepID=V4RI06_9HYPH|nr:putative lipoprotein [Lutibaculum baratangense AMV1]